MNRGDLADLTAFVAVSDKLKLSSPRASTMERDDRRIRAIGIRTALERLW
jgi:hypothetical protein